MPSASVPVERPLAVTVKGIFSASPASWSSSNSCGSSVAPRCRTGPGAEAVAPDLLLVRVGRVGGEGDVDRDREVGIERERGRARAREGDLLLGDGDRADVARGAARLGDQPRRLVGDVAPEAVVHRARDHAVVGQLDRLAGDHRDVADADDRARVVAVLRADVDVQVLELGRLAPLLLAQQVDRLLARRRR